jgi:hypothetical protein
MDHPDFDSPGITAFLISLNDNEQMTDEECRQVLETAGITKADLDRGLKRTMALVKVALKNRELHDQLDTARAALKEMEGGK